MECVWRWGGAFGAGEVRLALGKCVWRWGGAFGAGGVRLALGAASDISGNIIAYLLYQYIKLHITLRTCDK